MYTRSMTGTSISTPSISIKSANDTRMQYQTPKLRDLHAPAKHLYLPVDYADGPWG